MIYAPVMIITCNRIKHLKGCIKSLQRNSLAKFTDIYISVDYPPADKYFLGYYEVLDYVNGLADSEYFAKVNVFIQEKNLGTDKNLLFLENEIKKTYDRAIITEDDNIFAPNFLEYCDQYLHKYKNNPRIFCICGHQSYGEIKADNTAMLCEYMEPYGIGVWFDKYDGIFDWLSKSNVYSQICSIGKVLRFRNKHKMAFNLFVSGFLENPRYPYVKDNGDANRMDVFINMFMIMNDLMAVFPCKNLVENVGNDGTGINCGVGSAENVAISGSELAFDIDEKEPVIKMAAPKPKVNGILGWLRSQKPVLVYLFMLLKYRRRWKQ